MKFHSTRRLAALALAAAIVVDPTIVSRAQEASTETRGYIVFLQSRPIGREEVAVLRDSNGWVVRGNSRIGHPIDIVTRSAEIRYTPDWMPSGLSIEGTAQGQELVIKTTFVNGKAENTVIVAGKESTKTDTISPDAVILPNAFLGSYAALARRLVSMKAGATIRAYIPPQIEIPVQVTGVFDDRIETPQRAINATRYAVTFEQPRGPLPMTIWTEEDGSLLRVSIPAQALEIAREDVASASSRTTSFSLPTDEPVRIPASGFNLAASVARPEGVSGPLPAVVLVGGSGPTDRDSTVYGIPILGQLAGALVEAGFMVVRYDKRGVGQSGGRSESATIHDYVEDARAVVSWLDKRRDVDKKRIAIVGHSEGAWVALAAAAREKKIDAVVMLAGPATSGSQVVLEQQAKVFEQMNTPEAERQDKTELQKRINAAVLKEGAWEGISENVRKTAETPWFESYLSFEPARYMKDVRQPVLIVHGELDTQVAPHHADKLVELARSRKRKVIADVVKVPGVNHLLVPAKTGAVAEYATLGEAKLSPAVGSAVSLWLAKTLGPAESR